MKMFDRYSLCCSRWKKFLDPQRSFLRRCSRIIQQRYWSYLLCVSLTSVYFVRMCVSHVCMSPMLTHWMFWSYLLCISHVCIFPIYVCLSCMYISDFNQLNVLIIHVVCISDVCIFPTCVFISCMYVPDVNQLNVLIIHVCMSLMLTNWMCWSYMLCVCLMYEYFLRTYIHTYIHTYVWRRHYNMKSIWQYISYVCIFSICVCMTVYLLRMYISYMCVYDSISAHEHAQRRRAKHNSTIGSHIDTYMHSWHKQVQ
jgi:hypothetical protein